MEPVLRFKADDGSDFPDWEEKTLGELCAPLTYGMNAAATRFDGENRYIRITDIDDETHAYLSDDVVSPEGKLDDKYIVGNGDILLARTGASTGKSYLYHSKDGKLFYAGFLIKAHVLSSSDDYFVYSQTLTDKYWKWVKTTSMRSGQPGINATEYASYSFAVPSLPEQHKIADLLSTVDRVIAAQQAEVNAWEQRKKGVMQKLFSQEVRFKADDGSDFPDWEKKKLGEICEYGRQRGIGAHYVGTENMLKDFEGIAIDNPEAEASGSLYFEGDTLMSNIRPYLKKAWKANCNGVCSTDVLVFHPTNVESDYLHCVIASDSFVAYVMSAAKGSKMPRGDKAHIMHMPLILPSLPEQRKIADCLSSINDVIVKAKAELAKWQELKKGLLQQMFV
ncbi:restriction endonuclease subunit S [Bifidobacterium mizhiense]|uniref:restriction endonuclease subunit S n=1 Tax=Bifidobacterium mizhiense TaxID=2879940 RepID=UPI001E2EC9B3|nr:restriction endonuclease subunit S [Bifidobacterium mizhiense]